MEHRRSHRLAWLAAGAACLLAQGALAQTPVAAQATPDAQVRHVLPRLQVTRDAETGELRAPTPQEAAAMRAAPQASAARTSTMPADHPLARAAQAPQPQPRLGAVGRRFDMERMPYSVARIGADGQLETACVVGEEAAAKALSGQAALGKEHRHAR